MQRRVFMGVMVIALLGSFTFALAQEGDKKGKERGGRGNAMTAALEKAKLSDEQKEKVAAIMKESDEAAKTARENKDREGMQKVMAERQEKIMAVLTDDQKEIVKKHLAEAAAALGEKGKKKRPE